MGTVRRNSTYTRVSFYTFNPPPFNRIAAYDELAELVPGAEVPSSLVQWDYQKRLGEATGQVSIVLKTHKIGGIYPLAGQPWPELIEEGDWWYIEVIKNGVTQGISFGRIDNVAVQASAGATGTTTVNVVVTGRDVAFPFEDTPVYFNPFDASQDNAAGTTLQRMSEIVEGSADALVRNFINGMLGGLAPTVSLLGGHTKVPGGLGAITPLPLRYINLLNLTNHMDNLLARGIANTGQAIQGKGGGTVWDFINAWRNPSMNELWVDANPNARGPKFASASVYMREKPFVNTVQGLLSPWFRLPTWNVKASTVRSAQLSRGKGRVNHIQLVGDLAATGNPTFFGAYKPRVALDSIDKYGLRRIEEHTRFFTGASEAAFHTLHTDWLNLIVSWNALNHRYWAGRLDLGEMRAEIRIGQKIAVFEGPLAGYNGVFPSDTGFPHIPGGGFDLLTFYVEGIQHTWTEGEQPLATTSLMVSRGFVEGERVPAVTAAFAEWQQLAFTGQGAPLAGTGSVNVLPGSDTLTDALQDAGILKGGFQLGDYKAED